jgi:hypothetical protein
MKTYKIRQDARCILFRIIDNRADFFIAKFHEDSILSEADLFDSPNRSKLGMSMDIDDGRLSIVNEFAKHGYYVFERWKEDDRSNPDNRIITVLKSEDVQEVTK